MNTYELNYNLPDGIKRRLLEQSKSFTNFKKYLTNNLTLTELFFESSYNNPKIESSEINYLQQLINKKFKINAVVFLKFLPYGYIDPHVDDSLLRTSCITWALSPNIQDVSPVIYHNDDLSVNEIRYYTENPLILNTRNIHSVQNNNFERILVQLCFSNPIKELVVADFNNELFIKC